MKKLIKEPLLHFFALGALLFVLYSLVNKNSTDTEEIIVDNADVEHMVELWRLQWQRPPSAEELQGLIDKYVNQEVMYREALRLNLDHNDEIVKRRLAQKMEFLGNDLSSLVAPATDDNLKAYFEAHKEEYATDYHYTFHQIVFTTDNHKDPMTKAKSVLESATDLKHPESLKTEGDHFPLPYTFTHVDEFKLNREIGEHFTKQLPNLETGVWTGPVTSGFGVHLIYIVHKTTPKIPDFAEVKQEVLRNYEYQMIQDSKKAILNELKKNYSVHIQADNIESAIQQEFAENQGQ